MPDKDEKDVVKTTEHSEDATNETDSVREVLEAAGASTEPDDPNAPCLTLRMWVLGIGFCIFGSGLNTLYTLRKPSITLSQSVVQLLAFPLGKLWEKTIPDWGFRVGGRSFSLNPGPFNQKENILIYIMANLSFLSRLSADVLAEQQVYYGYDAGWGFGILMMLATFLIGFSLAGIFRPVIVAPPDMVWPGVLGVTALNKVLHGGKKEDITNGKTWRMSQYAFFSLAFCVSFVWYWFPDFIMTCLSTFSFPCWINPSSPVVNQVFGMSSGMGLLPITFDWSQISYIGSPLLVPTWAIVNVFAALIFWIWIIGSALFYSNVWSTAYLPFQSSSVFDNEGKKYSVKKVLNAATGHTLDVKAYEAYSPIYMPLTYALNTFGLAFATLSSLVVWMMLEQNQFMLAAAKRLRTVIVRPFRSEKTFTSTTSQAYKDVPMWWYAISTAVSIFLAIFCVEYWHVQLRWYGVLLALAVTLVFFVPISVVYATSNIKVSIDIFCRIVSGFAFPGKVLANIWFFNLGYISVIKALGMAQDLKLGIYCNIPARHVFLVQIVGSIAASLSYVGVIRWALDHIPGICTSDAVNNFTCAFANTHFNTSMIWGGIGPQRFFNSSIGYSSLLYFFLIGAVLPVPVYFIRRRYPNTFWRHVHVPLFLGCLNFLPPASGMNFASWAVVGLIFSHLIRRRAWAWWHKYNFVLSSALDCSVSIAGVIIFFAVFYSGASSNFKWWGTQVHKNTCDADGCPYISLGKGEKIG